MRPTDPRGRANTAPRISHHLFFALQPDDATRARIEAVALELRREHAPGGRWIKPDRYHMTLCYLGAHAALPDDLVEAARAAGDGVRSPPFDFALDVTGSFANRSIPWWLGCREMPRGLAMLWDAIDTGLSDGHVRDPARRVAHVTVLRDADRRLPPTPIAPIPWTVHEFVLIDSVLGPHARHSVIGRWRLET